MIPKAPGDPWGFSARELDRLARRSEGLCALIEAREDAKVTVETATAYAAVFCVPVGWLVAGEGPSPSKRQVREAVECAREAYRRRTGTDG